MRHTCSLPPQAARNKEKRKTELTQMRSHAQSNHNASGNAKCALTAQNTINANTVARSPQMQYKRQCQKPNESAEPNQLDDGRERAPQPKCTRQLQKRNELAEPRELEYRRAPTNNHHASGNIRNQMKVQGTVNAATPRST